MITTEDFTRVNNDVNGNPRYVIHFLNLLTVEESERLSKQYSFGGITESYAFAIKKANQIGGSKYRGKDFRGGIVFQSYNIQDTVNRINKLLENN